MVIHVILLLFYTLSIVLIKKKFNLILRNNIKEHKDKCCILFGHGAQTLINGMENMIALVIPIWMGLVFLYFDKSIIDGYYFSHHSKMLFLISIIISLPSNLYKISEIKHLADGISINTESDKFFIWYFKVGIYNLLIYLSLMVYMKLSALDYIIIILLVIFQFLLGMGDLLQTKGINNYGNLRYKINQTYRMIIDIPINITRAIFLKEERKDFKNNLINNLKNIIYGMKIMKNKYY